MARYQVFDLETESRQLRKRFASPWHPENFVVLRAWKLQGDKQCSWRYYTEKTQDYLRIPEDVTLLVGFNIKFDLLWEMADGNEDLRSFFKRGGAVWDCQYAEYLLQAQHPDYHMCSLDSIIESYGGRLKIDEVKKLWEAGVLTSQIPEDLLVDYAVGTEEEQRNSGDIGNTELIFLGQIKKAVQMGMLKAIQSRMDGLCATTEMEFNGLKIDVAEAGKRMKVLEAELAEAITELNGYIPELPDGLEFNWQSRVHVSALIFGGTIKYEKQAPYKDEATGDWVRKKATESWPLFDGVPVNPNGTDPVIGTDGNGLWYNISTQKRQDQFVSGAKKGEGKFKKVDVPGEIKVKYQDFFCKLPGYTEPDTEWKTEQTDGAGQPVYSTNDETIQELTTRNLPFCKALGRRAALVKELGTYYVRYDPKKKTYQGMLACVAPGTHIINHKLNHTSTVTTRLSSSDPNLQNVPRGDKSEVKKLFISRFLGGKMMEADYSQLEVVVQGLLSGDKNLCEDLRQKIDFHCKRVAAKFGCTYEEALFRCKDESYEEYKLWKKRRTGCKEFSFQRAYGAGAAAISYTTGMDIEDIKQMIEAEEAMYPGVVIYNEKVEKEVNRTGVPFRDPQRGFRSFRRGYYTSPTGCRYSFRSWDAPKFLKDKGINDSFSPPELKNYPVQGTGGEIVQMILGVLWRHFCGTDNYGGKALLVNTVHDCVWIDYHPDVEQELAANVKRIMESVPEELMRRFGMEVTVPFPVEVECGPNMYELHHVH